MEAKKLMIGDWVYNSYHNKNIKWDYPEMFCPNGTPVIGRDLKPIPLTPKTLEKNGFRWGLTTETEDLMSMGLGVPVTADKSWVWEDENGGVVSLTFPNESDGGEVWCRTEKKFSSLDWEDVIYIHELQHTLRLGGLTDLADNFKV